MAAPIEVIRSTRRRRSAQAHAREDGTIVVRVPAGLPRDQEAKVVRGLVDKVTGRRRASLVATDAQLQVRADALADRYLDGVRVNMITWSTRMEHRWASCSIDSGRIRVSKRLANVPSWVLDGVIVHELAHLQEPGHDRAFHALVARYPRHERVQGFLEGMQFARSQTAVES